ncbi:MAG TPA: DUF2283 domain-containing protein [Tepidisphaeraceae bacterium]|jgi:uncharacterized protein YuzE|nr:DUF2283 domain-containing protein [Tepidisphaeraceae bacterium]
MHLTYDPEFNVAYIRFRSRRAKVTTVSVSNEMNVDIGPDGRVYGIELLNANEQLGTARVKKLVFENRQSGKKTQLPLAG